MSFSKVLSSPSMRKLLQAPVRFDSRKRPKRIAKKAEKRGNRRRYCDGPPLDEVYYWSLFPQMLFRAEGMQDFASVDVTNNPEVPPRFGS